jgi:hypothetical protein
MISWDEWEDTYLPTTPLAYDDLDDIPDGTLPNYVWTMIDGDGRYANLTNGYRRFNRLGYFVTEKPWIEDVFVTDDKRMYA